MRGSQLIGRSLITRRHGQKQLDVRIAVSGKLFDGGVQRGPSPGSIARFALAYASRIRR